MFEWQHLKTYLQSHAHDFLMVVVLISVSIFLVVKIRKRFIYFIESKQGKRPLKAFLINLVSIILILTLVIVILGNFGIETSSLIALLGTAGLGIALSFKDALSHVAAGIMMVIDSPFKANDVIQIGDVTGTVDVVSLHSTLIRSDTNQFISIPNGKLINEKIINLTAGKLTGDSVTLTVAQNDTFEAGCASMIECVSAVPNVSNKPIPAVLVTGIAGSAINLKITYWAPATAVAETKSNVYKRLYQAHLAGEIHLV